MNDLLKYLADKFVWIIVGLSLSTLADLTVKPRVKDWWTDRPSRSRRSIENLIGKLESQLSQLVVDEKTDWILRGIETTILHMTLVAYLIIGCVGLVYDGVAITLITHHMVKQSTVTLILTGLEICVVATFVSYYVDHQRVRKMRRRVSPEYRMELEKRIERLKEKLARFAVEAPVR